MGRRKVPKPLPEGLVNSTGAARVLGVHPSTLYRWRVEEEDFPLPVQQGYRGRPTLFRVADLLKWKADRERAAGQSGTE